MNEYLTAMTNILCGGKRYLGQIHWGRHCRDVWGAHTHGGSCLSICKDQLCSCRPSNSSCGTNGLLEEEKWGKCYGLVKQMQTRIGCNTGTATVGNMGALDRSNYTMMGDMVNLAARCESGAKAYGAYIMITEETKLASEKTRDDIAFRYLDKIVVKGRSQPVAMYEPTGFMADLGQGDSRLFGLFQAGHRQVFASGLGWCPQDTEKAKELDEQILKVSLACTIFRSMILIDRCKVMKENPPGDDWDGV